MRGLDSTPSPQKRLDKCYCLVSFFACPKKTFQVLDRLIGIGPLIQQHLYNRSVSFVSGSFKGGLSHGISRIDVRALFKQQGCNLRMPQSRSKHQWRTMHSAALVDISPAFNKELNHGNISRFRGVHQRCKPNEIGFVNIRPLIDPSGDLVNISFREWHPETARTSVQESQQDDGGNR